MTARHRPKVLLIGLDCADADLIEAWMEEGRLPVLSNLRREGIWGRLRTTAESMHVSAWPTLYTSATPGQHGIYHAYQISSGAQAIARVEPARSARSPFWKYLDKAGRKCIIFDAFMNCCIPDFKGVQILDYGTWTWFGKPQASPAGMLKSIKRRFGRYPAPEHSSMVNVPAAPARFCERLMAASRVKSRITEALIKEHDWDFLFVTFAEPHGAGHYLWHAEDCSYPARGGAANRASHLLREVYAVLDQAIGHILSGLDDETSVIITSVDGMGPNYSASHLMPELLSHLGLLNSPVSGTERSSRNALLSALRLAIPIGLRQCVTRCLPRPMRTSLNLKWANAGIDWNSSKVFCIPNSNEAYFRVNLKGREPCGIVSAGAEYDELLGLLTDELRLLKNPDNGVAAAAQVVLTRDLFPGERCDDLPDLLVTWNNGACVLDALQGPSAGLIRGRSAHATPPFYTGNHRPNAFIAARGPGFKEGGRLQGGHILDVAPTVMAALGVDSPPHFEGEVFLDCVR